MARATTRLSWRRPASMASLASAVVAGLLAVAAIVAGGASHDRRWFLVALALYLVFLAFVAYGLVANRARERRGRRPRRIPGHEPDRT